MNSLAFIYPSNKRHAACTTWILRCATVTKQDASKWHIRVDGKDVDVH